MSAPIPVEVTIIAAPPAVPEAGFNKLLIASQNAAWTDGLIREYTALAGGVSVDFATTTPEYKAAAKFFSQPNPPASLLIGKTPSKSTQEVHITPVVHDTTKYQFTIDGHHVVYTSDGSATADEIINGLKAAADAFGLGITFSNVSSTYLKGLANAAGAWFDYGLFVTDSGIPDPNLSAEVLHADGSPGIAADLDALAQFRSDWYGLVTLQNSQALVKAAAAWANANGRLYGALTVDSTAPETAAGGGDLGQALKTSAYDRTFCIFSPQMSDFLDAAIFAQCFAFKPGSETWKFKIPAGVPAGTYTPTQRTNLRAKYINFDENVGGQNIFQEGQLASGDFIDFRRYLDFLISTIQSRIFNNVLMSPPKAPYDDGGIHAIEAELIAFCQAEEARRAIRSGWTITAPKAAAQTSNDRANRKVSGVVLVCTYASAIHDVAISAVVSL